MLKCALAGVIVASLSACYTTAVTTSARSGPEYSDKQWFLFYGAARVGSPAGGECGSSGVAWAESKQSFSDHLITFGITTAAGLAIGSNCESDAACYAQAFSMGGVVASLLQTRTVSYGCRIDDYPSAPARRPVATPVRPAKAAPQETERPATDRESEGSTAEEAPRPVPAAKKATAPAKALPATAQPSKKLSDESCFESDFCQKYGRCASDGTRCVAPNDAACKLSLMCQVMGKCVARAGECVKP